MSAAPESRPEIRLVEPGHVYLVNGVARPSVTQILEDVGISDYSGIPAETRERALARGSRVHAAIHYDLEGALDDSSVSDEDAPYLEAARRFIREKRFHAELIEHRGYNAVYGFAGTLDCSGWFEGHQAQPLLIDWKTGQAEFWVRLQTAAYASFFKAPRTFTRVCVELHGDGTYRLIVFEGRNWQQDFAEFQYGLAVWRIKRERKWK